MIIVNGVPKSGTMMLVQYLVRCGFQLDQNGLVAYGEKRDIFLSESKPWGKRTRTLGEVLGDYSDRLIHAHVYDQIDLSGHKVLFIYRHPRNVAVSRARWHAVEWDWLNHRQPSRLEVLARLPEAMEKVAGVHREFEGWLRKAGLRVRFENLIETPQESGRRICRHLGIGYRDPVGVLGDAGPWINDKWRGTWSGRHSDWREWWTDEIDQMWALAGGLEVEAVYGY